MQGKLMTSTLFVLVARLSEIHERRPCSRRAIRAFSAFYESLHYCSSVAIRCSCRVHCTPLFASFFIARMRRLCFRMLFEFRAPHSLGIICVSRCKSIMCNYRVFIDSSIRASTSFALMLIKIDCKNTFRILINFGVKENCARLLKMNMHNSLSVSGNARNTCVEFRSLL